MQSNLRAQLSERLTDARSPSDPRVAAILAKFDRLYHDGNPTEPRLEWAK